MTDVDADPVAPPPWHRRRWLVYAGAVAVVAAVVGTLLATSSGDGDARPVPSGAMPTLGSQFATPPPAPDTSEPAGPPVLPAYSGAPLWTVALPRDGEDAPDFAVTDHGYVLTDRTAVVGLDRTGKQVWRHVPPEVDYFTVRVTGRQVFVGYANAADDRWPQPQVVIALDAATGTEQWREVEASFWSVTTDAIYLSVCRGGQNNHIGDCQFTARDPRTNTVRWRIPTYASASVVNDSGDTQAAPTPPYLLIGSYPTGRDSFILSTHDPRTGATLGRGYRRQDGPVGSFDLATERTVTTTGDQDDNPADGCQAVLTGYAVSGAGETWRHTVRTTKGDEGRRCARQPVSLNRGRMGVTETNGAPSVLNLDTGAVEWSAPPTGAAIAASDTTLLVVDGTELLAYRVGNATPVWRAPFTGALDTSTVLITGTQVVVTDTGEAIGYDLATGNAWSYGTPVTPVTGASFAVCDTGSCRGYAIG